MNEHIKTSVKIFRRLAPLLLATRKVNIQQPTEIKRK